MEEMEAAENDEDGEDIDDVIVTKYFEIVDRYAVNRNVCKGINYGDPPRYHPGDSVISVEIDKQVAKVSMQQHHLEKFDRSDPDPNYKVHYRLRQVKGEWRVSSRVIEDYSGEKFDVGL